MLKHDFSHLMSHSANDSFLFALHLAVGVLDKFPFSLAAQKKQSYYTKPVVTGLSCVSYTVSRKIHEGVRVGVI